MAEAINLGDTASLASAKLGGPGRLDPAQCSLFAIKTLRSAAGETMNLASFSLEMGSTELGAEDVVVAHVGADKRTHAIAFFSIEARAAGAPAFTARAVFSVR